jgi:Holliday junction DNA helicase RuvA
VIREDAHLLYGFSSLAERELFLLLISVSGVGANTARMILSSNSPDGVVQIISSADERGLTMIKGIGAKTAQRIIVDLRSKVKLSGGGSGGGVPSLPLSPKEELSAEAISALVMLGFQKAASEKVVEKLLSQAQEEYTVERLIKLALRELK